jgi:hypothetical protein
MTKALNKEIQENTKNGDDENEPDLFKDDLDIILDDYKR